MNPLWRLKLACLLSALLLPALAHAQYTFTTNTDGTLNISAFSGSGAVTIPDTYNNLPITTVGNNSFHLSGLSSVTMGTNIISIGNGAFSSCFGLKSVTFGPRTGSIGNGAFSSDSVLKNIVIPDSVTNFGNNIFISDPKLNNVILGNGVPTLPNYTFEYCTSLTNVNIGSGVASFGNGVFTQCPLQAINVDPANQFYCSVDGVFYDKNQTKVIVYPYAKGGSTYVIPDSVTVIGDDAFYNCTSFTSIVIPNHVTDLGVSAFSGCSSLANLTIGSSVVNLGTASFENCSSLTSVVLPDTIGTIGQYPFYNCTALTNVIIGRGCTTIVGGAFLTCPNLLGVYFKGNAPSSSESFSQDNLATAYYLPGTLGWTPRFGDPYGLPTAPWVQPGPQVLNFESSLGVQTNKFGFVISWATNVPAVIEACTNLSGNGWKPVSTNTLSGGTTYFSDPQWTNFPVRYYRVRTP